MVEKDHAFLVKVCLLLRVREIEMQETRDHPR